MTSCCANVEAIFIQVRPERERAQTLVIFKVDMESKETLACKIDTLG